MHNYLVKYVCLNYTPCQSIWNWKSMMQTVYTFTPGIKLLSGIIMRYSNAIQEPKPGEQSARPLESYESVIVCMIDKPLSKFNSVYHVLNIKSFPSVQFGLISPIPAEFCLENEDYSPCTQSLEPITDHSNSIDWCWTLKCNISASKRNINNLKRPL